jgi:hypothetical protein
LLHHGPDHTRALAPEGGHGLDGFSAAPQVHELLVDMKR